MSTNKKSAICNQLSIRAVAGVLSLGAAILCTNAWAQKSPMTSPSAAAPKAADLEQTFWKCDYVATTRGIDQTRVAVCGAAYEELKRFKFNGDFEAFLAWWRRTKPEAHAQVANAERSEAARFVGYNEP